MDIPMITPGDVIAMASAFGIDVEQIKSALTDAVETCIHDWCYQSTAADDFFLPGEARRDLAGFIIKSLLTPENSPVEVSPPESQTP